MSPLVHNQLVAALLGTTTVVVLWLAVAHWVAIVFYVALLAGIAVWRIRRATRR